MKHKPFQPPGYQPKLERIVLLILALLAMFLTVIYFIDVAQRRRYIQNLIERDLWRLIDINVFTVPSFQGLFLPSLIMWLLIPVATIAFMVRRRHYYLQGSRSLDLVRRLPQRHYFARTCYAELGIILLITLLLMAIIMWQAKLTYDNFVAWIQFQHIPMQD